MTGTVKYHKGSVGDAVRAAKALKGKENLYVYPTGEGMAIGKEPPPFGIQHIIVKPDGTHQVVSAGASFEAGRRAGVEPVSKVAIPRTGNPSVSTVFEGIAYRVDIENYGIPRDATAGDIIRFERDELGNQMDVSDALLKELDRYSHKDVIWVTKFKKDAEVYLPEGYNKKDISIVDVGKGARIVVEDGQGGYLILKGGAIPKPGNPSVSKKAITEAEVEAKAEIARLIRESRSTADALKSARMELEAIEAELGKRTIPYGGDFYRKRRGKLPQAFPGVPGAILDVKRTIYKEFIEELERQLEIPKTRKQMLIDYDRGHTLEQLKEMCRAKGFSASGDKKTLIGRLI